MGLERVSAETAELYFSSLAQTLFQDQPWHVAKRNFKIWQVLNNTFQIGSEETIEARGSTNSNPEVVVAVSGLNGKLQIHVGTPTLMPHPPEPFT